MHYKLNDHLGLAATFRTSSPTASIATAAKFPTATAHTAAAAAAATAAVLVGEPQRQGNCLFTSWPTGLCQQQVQHFDRLRVHNAALEFSLDTQRVELPHD